MCEINGIPTYLHRNDRDDDQFFSSTEKLFRRFYKELQGDLWVDDNNLTASIFPINNDSCVRGKYSKSPKDALFNTNATSENDHFLAWGILEVECRHLLDFKSEIKQKEDIRLYTAIPFHDPEDCIYPHTEIIVQCNGSILKENRPKSVKAKLRDILISECTIIQHPTK
jgi:hypothetical protein